MVWFCEDPDQELSPNRSKHAVPGSFGLAERVVESKDDGRNRVLEIQHLVITLRTSTLEEEGATCVALPVPLRRVRILENVVEELEVPGRPPSHLVGTFGIAVRDDQQVTVGDVDHNILESIIDQRSVAPATIACYD